jgi:hypothetical protein
MVDLQNTFELLKWAGGLLADSATVRPAWFDPFWAAVVAVVIGFILALWGGRVLRVIFVLLFMAAGAVMGKRFADSMQLELLIGLVIGGGLAGAIGYWVYRWCLGLTLGAVVALIVAVTFSAPTLLNERQTFDDFRLGVGTGQYTMPATPLYSWTAVRSYFWEQPRGRNVVMKSLIPVGLAAAFGFALSVLAPRFGARLATAVLGSILLAGGAAALIASKRPETWARIQAHEGWAVGVVLFFWLFSLLYQTTHPARPAVPSPVPPAPAPAAS